MHHMVDPAATGVLRSELISLFVFWMCAVVHLIRLLAGHDEVGDCDPTCELAHGAMGAGMAYMLFPSTPTGLAGPLAVLFGLLAVGLVVAPRRQPGPAAVRRWTSAMGALAMVAMLLGGKALSLGLVEVLSVAMVGCAGLYAWQGIRAWQQRVVGAGTAMPWLTGGGSAAQTVMSVGMAVMLIRV